MGPSEQVAPSFEAAPFAPFAILGDATTSVIATAIHAGHQVRSEIAELLDLDEATRLREEDPHTDQIAAAAASTCVLVFRSRFEVDLNRRRDEAIYSGAEQSWGLRVWKHPPPADVLSRSLHLYDAFYAGLARHLDRMAERGPFLLLDVHSYNHRRTSDGRPGPQDENPDVNVGTGSMDARWHPVIDALMANLGSSLVAGRFLDVRENINFRGRELARWVHERYAGIGCAPALEFKKTYMDERSGAVDDDHVDSLGRALKAATTSAVTALARVATWQN